MANNFKLSIHRTNNTLHIDLIGDFDGNSAFELLNILKDNLNGITRVIIDTGELKRIYPFGREVFNHNFSRLKNHGTDVEFMGENAI
jgi:hypothetical protein